MRIVPALDEVEDRKRCLSLRLESVLHEKLALESSVEALAHCVVVAVADGTIDIVTPASLHRFPKAIDVYCDPWSE